MEVETVTTAPENIQPVKLSNPSGKHWAGCTLNNPTAADEACWLAKIQPLATYYVYGKEVGASGTPHFQFMVSFAKQTRLSAVRKLFPSGGNWEVKSPRSTMKEASDYCKKDGNFIEWGVLPLDQKVAGLKVIADKYADTINKAKVGKFNDIDAEHQLRYYRTIKEIAADNKVMPENLDWKEGEQPNFWIYGNAGYGKSFDARKRLGNKFYAKIAANKWWDKYKGEENVLIEDFDKSHAYQIANLKIWADVYAFPVEIKYGNDVIRPKVIGVTSNYSIKEIWPDPIEHEPLLRRFKEIHKEQKWNATIDGVLKSKKTKAPKTLLAKTPKKVKKNHLPLKKPALYKQNASGDIVPNKQDQIILDDALQKKPKEVIMKACNVDDLIEMHIEDIEKTKSAATQDIDTLANLATQNDRWAKKDGSMITSIIKNNKVLRLSDTQEIPNEKDIIELDESEEVSSISEECVGCTNIKCICNHLLWTEHEWDKYETMNDKSFRKILNISDSFSCDSNYDSDSEADESSSNDY